MDLSDHIGLTVVLTLFAIMLLGAFGAVVYGLWVAFQAGYGFHIVVISLVLFVIGSFVWKLVEWIDRDELT